MEGRIRGLHQTDSCLRITHEPNTIAEWLELGVTRLQHLVHKYERGTFSDVQGSKATGPDFNVVTRCWSRLRLLHVAAMAATANNCCCCYCLSSCRCCYTVVRSCCSEMLPCVCILRLLPFYLCLPATAVCSPKFCPAGWCLHTFGTHTSCVKTQEFARTCVYVCAHFHTSMACVCKSSSAERRAVQAGSEHSSALTSACTPSSGNGMLRRRAGAAVKALRTRIA